MWPLHKFIIHAILQYAFHQMNIRKTVGAVLRQIFEIGNKPNFGQSVKHAQSRKIYTTKKTKFSQ
jgi:hypothetical protein